MKSTVNCVKGIRNASCTLVDNIYNTIFSFSASPIRNGLSDLDDLYLMIKNRSIVAA
jgi:hypothetical protein